MKERVIVDFENEIRNVCKKYEAEIAHAALVGVLTVVAHIYMKSQLENFKDKEDEGGSSPKPQEAKK